MFSLPVESVQYITDKFADNHPLLSKIDGGEYDTDRSMKAVSRILLFNRIPEKTNFKAQVVPEITEKVLETQTNRLYFVNCEDADTRNLKNFTKLQKNVDFLKKWMTCSILINEDKNLAVIFVKDLDTRKLHICLTFFPNYFPNLFKDKPLTDDEKQLCITMTKRTANNFYEKITELIEKYGFANEARRELLRNYTKNNIDRLIQSAIEARDRAERDLERNIDEYKHLYDIFYNAKMQVELMHRQTDENDEELLDYFDAHKNLRLSNVEGSTIKFFVLTELTWFDLDFYQKTARNNSIYETKRTVPGFEKTADRKLLLDAIFSDDPKFRVRMCNYYELSIANDVRVRMDFECPGDIAKKYIKNPHMKYHACLGNYHTPIRNALRNNNMIGAIEQCVASAQSVDLIEHEQTFKPFITELLSSDNKYIIDNEGNEYNAKEALQKLKEKA